MTTNTPTHDHTPGTRLVRRIGILSTAVTLGAATVAAAHPSVADGRGMLIRTFDESAPAVGDPMPDLPVYAPDGQESRLPALLDGRFTVLILGCLT